MSQVVLQVDIKVAPENLDRFLPQLLANAKAARSEPGCRQFEVLQDPDDKTRLMLFEVYDDQKAFEAHQAGSAFKKYLAEAVPLVASRTRHFWKKAL
jgi:autoinducer 2-degrading protein